MAVLTAERKKWLTSHKLIYALACSSVPQNQYCSLALPNGLCAISSADSGGKQCPHLLIKEVWTALMRTEFIDAPQVSPTQVAQTLGLKNLSRHTVAYTDRLLSHCKTLGAVCLKDAVENKHSPQLSYQQQDNVTYQDRQARGAKIKAPYTTWQSFFLFF